jgi:hypothetical protein
MAFPATYDFNYYKGDTFEFRIYPKKDDGTAHLLGGFTVPTNFANNPDYVLDISAPYDSAQFTISTVRGSTGTPIRCFAKISDDGTFVQCAIRPSDSIDLNAGTEYVYDVEVRAAQGNYENPFYEKVHTLMTGKITVTDQVTGAQLLTSPSLSSYVIRGVSAPVTCGVPVTTVFETAEHTGTVSWLGSPETFAPGTTYTATITILPKAPYKISGTAKDAFIVEGATSVNNNADSGIVTAVFPRTAEVVSLSAITGITSPVKNATPITTAETTQYTCAISWKEKSIEDPVVYSDFTGNFKASRTYKAFVTLTAKTGYTLCGVAANFFSVTGALSYANSSDSGIVTAEFPATGA